MGHWACLSNSILEGNHTLSETSQQSSLMANWGNHRMYAGPTLAILEAQTNMGNPSWWDPQSSERTMHRNGLLPEAWTGRANQQGGSGGE